MQTFHSFYNLDKKIVLNNLESRTTGLSNIEISERQRKYGKNIFNEDKKKNIFETFLLQFLSPLIFTLLFASIITIYLDEVIETVVIISAILMNVFFSTFQEYKAENTIEQLKKFVKNQALVKRNGEAIKIDAEDLTVGDIVILQYGSRVPADIRILESIDLKIDESILTGESLPVEKRDVIVTDSLLTERVNYCFCGTLVTNGNGVGVVTDIGQSTEIGKIAKSISDTKKILTPVQNAVNKISWYIFTIALLIVVFVFLLGIYRGEDFFEMLVLASAIAVGAVPEALPIALTVILSIGVLNISKKGGLIRKLAAAETLGSTTLILTDKTGTLTEGKLSLENIITQKSFAIDTKSEAFSITNLGKEQINILQLAKNNFSVAINKNSKDKTKWLYSGNAFEVILSKIILENNLFEKGEKDSNWSKIILPFNSTNKYSVSQTKNEFVVLGAPDILINSSNFSQSEKEVYLNEIKKYSEEGKRLVAIGSKNVEGEFFLERLDFLGFFVFSDILRKNINKSISGIVSAGVKVKMMTGDLPGTAMFIANKIGLAAEEDEIITGSQLESFSDKELIQILPRIKVFARVTPEDKLRIGKLYQQLGEVVAMTGDGVNDSPSLKAMDIGISLSSGSEVAKSASDMILIRDNFKTIVDTISVGHNIKKNIQKVFVYLMSNSLDGVFVVTGSLIAGLSTPLTALQIIWVNILTGTLPALAFAYDKNYKFGVNSREIFSFKVKFLALGIGTFSSFLLFVLYYLLAQSFQDIELAKSIFFLCFATYILVASYSFIDLDRYIWQYNPFSNWRLNIGVAVGLILIFATVYTEAGQNIFQILPVPIQDLWILIVWLIINLWTIEIAKFFVKGR